MRVYEVKYEHLTEPINYGLFKSLENAEAFLKSMGVDIKSRRSYFENAILFYDGSYSIIEIYVREWES